MSALGLSWTVADGSTMGAAAFPSGGFTSSGYVVPSGSSDLIGAIPLNPATLTPPGYVDTAAQYAADQLTFAFSLGEYTAAGATPQTFAQNLLGSASPLSQFSAASQGLYNTVSIQSDQFAMNASRLEITSYGNLYSVPYAGIGFSGGNTAFGPAFSTSSTTAYSNTTLVTIDNHGLDTISGASSGLTETGLNPGSAGSIAVPSTVSGVSTGAPSLFGQTSDSATPSTVGQVTGAVGAITPAAGTPTANPAAVAVSEGVTGQLDTVAQGQGVLGATGSTLATFSPESLNIKISSSDPFAHYSSVDQGHQSLQGMILGDHASSGIQDTVSTATAIGGGSIDSGVHFITVADTHNGQVIDAHIEAIAHALLHSADTGGHLA